MGRVMRALPWISGAGALVFLVAATLMGSLERAGPAHADLWLEGGIPATLYLPGEETGRAAFQDPPPRAERPPAVVLMHGFANDRSSVSSLARRLAHAGYAVLAFDVAGHGQNRNPFPRGRARADAYHADYRSAVDFLRASPLVDGERIAVMGHSMGAGASLDFATRDQGIDATVLISGGWSIQGPHRPRNALFLYASGDPARIEQRVAALASRLAGVVQLAPSRTHGDPARGDAVRVVDAFHLDHATIIWSERAAREIAGWLDAAFGRARASVPDLPDPRLPVTFLLAASLLLVLPGLGLVVGRLAPALPERGGDGGARSLGLLAGALLLGMPLLATDTPAAMLSLEVADLVVGHLALVGVGLLVFLALRGERFTPLRPSGRVVAAAAVGVVAVYALLLPLGVVVHRLTLTPERTLAFLAMGVALLPFSCAFQWLLRRGPPRRAALLSALGRVLVLAVLLLGVSTGLLSRVVVLMLPALALVFVLFELLAGAIYAGSRNVALIALIDAAWLALIVAAFMPMRA